MVIYLEMLCAAFSPGTLREVVSLFDHVFGFFSVCAFFAGRVLFAVPLLLEYVRATMGGYFLLYRLDDNYSRLDRARSSPPLPRHCVRIPYRTPISLKWETETNFVT